MTDRREAILANAKYLRNVRPIDPEEICGYVEGGEHPGVVRQILRESAGQLGLIEREDGTFVPVSDDPVSPLSSPVERLPERYERRLEDALVERYGPGWQTGVSGELLRSTTDRIKARYFAGDPVTYDEDAAAAYAIYHLPGYFAAVQYALSDLAAERLLDRHLRVLDVGAGVGGPALGLCEFLPDDALVEYHAVEPSAAADLFEALCEETGRNVHTHVHRTTAEAFDLEEAVTERGPFDLVLFGNVLSELTDPEAVLRRYFGAIEDDGTVLAVAPADKATSIQLRSLERAVEDESVERQPAADGRTTVTVYGPTVRLWPGEHPTDRGWSFDVRPSLAVPPFQRKLAEGAADTEPETYVNVDVQFSYTIFRLDGRRRIDLELDPSRWAKMAEMDRHVTKRVDLVAAKLSHSLSDDPDANPLFKVSDGSESVDHYAVVTAETALNRPLAEAAYGAVLALENVLVLWNDDESAYNLVVDEETVVDPVAP